MDELNAAMVDIDKNFDIVKVKDRFSNPKDSGYRDVNIIIKNENGALSELQLHTEKMYEAKREEETVYNEYRKFEDEAEALQKKSKLTKEEQTTLDNAKQKIAERDAQSNKIYNDAWKKETGQYNAIQEFKNTVSNTYNSIKTTAKNAVNNLYTSVKGKLNSLKFWK